MPRAVPREHAIQAAKGLLNYSPDESVNQEYERGMCELLARTYGGDNPVDIGEAACEMMVAIRPQFTMAMANEALYGDGETIWYAFEIMTETSFLLYAYKDVHDANKVFDAVSNAIPVGEHADCIRGTVMALTLSHALCKIRWGIWHSKDE